MRKSVENRKIIMWASGMYGKKERRVQSFRGMRERDHLEDLDVDGRIILRWIFTK
jgi:hypothetical protein